MDQNITKRWPKKCPPANLCLFCVPLFWFFDKWSCNSSDASEFQLGGFLSSSHHFTVNTGNVVVHWMKVTGRLIRKLPKFHHHHHLLSRSPHGCSRATGMVMMMEARTLRSAVCGVSQDLLHLCTEQINDINDQLFCTSSQINPKIWHNEI